MAKEFASRVRKKDRNVRDISAHLDQDLFRLSDEKLLQGARLDDIDLAKIEVKLQVRTKFNDDSIQELANNIRENGLIQPIVVHREGNKFVLICGERRFRAMSTIEDMKFAPCFILEDKTSVGQRLTATRILTLGIFSLAAPKKKKNKEYCIVFEWEDDNGEKSNAVFEFSGMACQELSTAAFNKLKEYKPITTKKCPFCDETIKIKATICKYCNKELT